MDETRLHMLTKHCWERKLPRSSGPSIGCKVLQWTWQDFFLPCANKLQPSGFDKHSPMFLFSRPISDASQHIPPVPQERSKWSCPHGFTAPWIPKLQTAADPFSHLSMCPRKRVWAVLRAQLPTGTRHRWVCSSSVPTFK